MKQILLALILIITSSVCFAQHADTIAVTMDVSKKPRPGMSPLKPVTIEGYVIRRQMVKKGPFVVAGYLDDKQRPLGDSLVWKACMKLY